MEVEGKVKNKVESKLIALQSPLRPQVALVVVKDECHVAAGHGNMTLLYMCIFQVRRSIEEGVPHCKHASLTTVALARSDHPRVMTKGLKSVARFSNFSFQ